MEVMLPDMSPGPAVYFVGAAPASRLVKIGRTVNVARRFEHLQAGSPVPLTLLAVVRTFDCPRAEERFHEVFAAERAHAEWFDLGDDPMATVAWRIGDLDAWVSTQCMGQLWWEVA
jgi:hypothetical protein